MNIRTFGSIIAIAAIFTLCIFNLNQPKSDFSVIDFKNRFENYKNSNIDVVRSENNYYIISIISMDGGGGTAFVKLDKKIPTIIWEGQDFPPCSIVFSSTELQNMVPECFDNKIIRVIHPDKNINFFNLHIL
jgi:hypothetical protein